MDILDWINKEIESLGEIYESGVSPAMKAASRHKIVTLKKVAQHLRKEYGWQPGPPPADPEDGSQWELDFPETQRGPAQRVLCTFRAIQHVGYSHPGISYEDAHWAVRHRRIMPAPGEV